ncbi:MAG: Na+/H+ antiporter subunit E [Pseudomonadota bacterium]
MSARPPVLLVLGLTGMWLLLNSTLAFGHIVLGLTIALLMVFGFRAVRPLQPTLRRPQMALLLLWRVFVDILRSNLGVARVVLGLYGKRTPRSGFVDIPLDMRDAHGLAALATIVTSTPGTIWVNLSPDGATLTLHVLDIRDEKGWIDTIKHRYESLLIEIFE